MDSIVHSLPIVNYDEDYIKEIIKLLSIISQTDSIEEIIYDYDEEIMSKISFNKKMSYKLEIVK